MPESPLADLDRLLEDERAALVAGDFDALPAIVARKEALIAVLPNLERTALHRLRARAERNAELLAASAKGLRSVIRRVAEIRSANGPLKTYGQDGTQRTLGPSAGSFEKRA